MNRRMKNSTLLACFIFTMISVSFFSCKKCDDVIVYRNGIFPDSLIALTEINSTFDDYNTTTIPTLDGYDILVFSSNRNSSGSQFDLVQGFLSFSFNQTTGEFNLIDNIGNDALATELMNKVNTDKDDLGPYRFFCAIDGYEYLILSSETQDGTLDLYYVRNKPAHNTAIPDISNPMPVTSINTSANDGYFSINHNKDTAYFCSDIEGVFNIYMKPCTEKLDLTTWLSNSYTSSSKVDSINSSYNDKCPFIYFNTMVFASDRPGGLGGYDLYYSTFKNGTWGAPINFGPSVNSENNEYRPIIGFNTAFSNRYMIFSSDRPGGKGGYDLYFKGVSFNK